MNVLTTRRPSRYFCGVALTRITYSLLNARQKEAYNFQKVSGVLADYGYCTIRLSDDWGGADFIAQHMNGTFLAVQLKGRLSFAKKYENKNLWMCFPGDDGWYLYPHDQVLADVMGKMTSLEMTQSWSVEGAYTFPRLNATLRNILDPFHIDDCHKAAIL